MISNPTWCSFLFLLVTQIYHFAQFVWDFDASHGEPAEFVIDVFASQPHFTCWHISKSRCLKSLQRCFHLNSLHVRCFLLKTTCWFQIIFLSIYIRSSVYDISSGDISSSDYHISKLYINILCVYLTCCWKKSSQFLSLSVVCKSYIIQISK